MAYANDRHIANGLSTSFPISFPFLQSSHVKVFLNGVQQTTGYTVVGSSVVFTNAPSNGSTVQIVRDSDRGNRLVNYVDAAALTAAILERDSRQSLYVAQEAFDEAETAMKEDATGQFDAEGKRIKNLATPTQPGDAATKSYVDSVSGVGGGGPPVSQEAVRSAFSTTLTLPTHLYGRNDIEGTTNDPIGEVPVDSFLRLATSQTVAYRWVVRTDPVTQVQSVQQQIKRASAPDSEFVDIPGSTIPVSAVVSPPPSPPPIPPSELTMTLNAPSGVTQNAATISVTIAGPIPSGAKVQIQITTNQDTGPWRSSNDDLGSAPNATAGTFTHTFSGLTASTTYYYRAFIYNESPLVIHRQNDYPFSTFSTLASGGGSGTTEPPTNFSTQLAVNLMTAGPNGDDWDAWGYPPNKFGGVVSIGARLKHNTDLQNYCGISPYQDMLPTIFLQWLTVSHKFRPGVTNDAIEVVARPMYGRIRPDLNGGAVQWIQLTTPTGAVDTGLIATGSTIGTAQSRENGRVVRLSQDLILHPWAVMNNSPRTVDAPAPAGISQQPGNPFADSRLDCVVGGWWVRVVRWDTGGAAVSNLNTNPVIAVASADPYVGRPRRVDPGNLSSAILNDAQCVAGIAANRPVRITTEWTQVTFATLAEAPDKHVSLPHSFISSAAFLSNPPPGYV